MEIQLTSSSISGKAKAPPSKSHTHRALMCGSLAQGVSMIRDPLSCDDTAATMRLCTSLGARISQAGPNATVHGGNVIAPHGPIDCGSSATTLRLGMALAALGSSPITLTGSQGLRRRPVGPLASALGRLGATCGTQHDSGLPPVTVTGPLRGGSAELPGGESSQYLSALLLACPLAQGDTEITLSSPLESRPYVDMTLSCMSQFGVSAEADLEARTVHIPGGQEYRATDVQIEGDFSSAAFLMVAAAISGTATIDNLPINTAQGDGRIVSLLKEFGAAVTRDATSVSVTSAPLCAQSVDCADIPDLVPVLAVLGTQASGTTVLQNIGRLRIKESDRIAAITRELAKMGADIKADKTALHIHGPTPLRGACIDPHDDHRIAMACAVASLVASGTTTIRNVECMEKSYPEFLSDFAALGGGVSGK